MMMALFAGPGESVSAARKPDAVATYRIERDDKPVGSYQVRVYNNRQGADIDTRLSLVTRVGPFKVRMTHESAEAWSAEGRLTQLFAETDRNGDTISVRALPRADGILMIEADGKTQAAPADVLPNSFSHTNARFGDRTEKVALLDVLSGSLRLSTIVPRGVERIACATGTCEARHYDVVLNETGKVTHSLWLDASGAVLRLVANTRFGISFAYIRESATTGG